MPLRFFEKLGKRKALKNINLNILEMHHSQFQI